MPSASDDVPGNEGPESHQSITHCLTSFLDECRSERRDYNARQGGLMKHLLTETTEVTAPATELTSGKNCRQGKPNNTSPKQNHSCVSLSLRRTSFTGNVLAPIESIRFVIDQASLMLRGRIDYT
jgi:hypothetical protein